MEEAFDCLNHLVSTIAEGKCYILRTTGGCSCAVELHGGENSDTMSVFYNAKENMREVLNYNQYPEMPNWGVSREGTIGLMYWCDQALQEDFWKQNYGSTPWHWSDSGWIDTTVKCGFT
jgi:hypothetical protein